MLPPNRAPLPAGRVVERSPFPCLPAPEDAVPPTPAPLPRVSGPACAGMGDVTVFTRGSWHGSTIRNVENGACVESCAVLSAPLCCL